MADYSYIGTGKVYVKERDSAAGLIEVGNVSKLEFSVEEDTAELRDYTSPGGGVLNEVRRVKGVAASMTLTELKPQNIAIMLYGSSTAGSATAITDEELVVYKGALTRLANIPDTTETLTVKNDTDGSPGSTTYDVDDDYVVRPGGIYIPAASAIGDGATVHVAYKSKAADVIEALTASAKEYELFFEGLNEAQSGKPFLVDAFRVRFGATKAFSLIGDNFASYELTGKVLKDTTKVGTGDSQFFKATSQA